MVDASKFYLTGEKILPGDIIRNGRERARIAFVIGQDRPWDPEWRDSQAWFETTYGRGFMMIGDDTGPTFYDEVNEDIVFLNRGT